MEKRNGSITLTSPLYEGSSPSYVTATRSAIDADTHTTPLYNWTNVVKRRRESTQQGQFGVDYTTFSMDTGQTKPSQGETLSSTHILLIAVLVMCFATLTSVMVMCICFLRRQCKKRGKISQSAIESCHYQTTLMSKATSITGLSESHEYYSMKVEKKDHFSPSVIVDDKCIKIASTAGELGAEKIVDSCQSVFLSSPTCRPPVEDAAPVYFKMKNVLTSTPAAAESQHSGGEMERVAPQGAAECTVSSPLLSQGVMTSFSSPPSVYTSAFSSRPMPVKCDSLTSPHSDLSNEEASSDQLPAHCFEKVPLTQSVSWFVPLDGCQREPIRHSVVELLPEELGIEKQTQQRAGSSSSGQQRSRATKAKKYAPHGEKTLHEGGEDAEIRATTAKPNLRLRKICYDNPKGTNAAFYEDMPLINCKKNAASSLLAKRSRLKSTMSEDNSPIDDADSSGRARSRSLSSPGDNSMWKQREERPVLFLGSGIE